MEKMNELVLRTMIKTFFADRKGVTAIEYGLIAGLIAVAIVGVLGTLGSGLTNAFSNVSNSLSTAGA